MCNKALGTAAVNHALDPASTAVATLSPTSGPVGTKTTLSVTGMSASSTGSVEVDLVSVTGSRVTATGTCWGYTYTSLGSGVVGADGTLYESVSDSERPRCRRLSEAGSHCGR